MKRINKYLYLFVLQGYYDKEYGWEDLTENERAKEILADLKDYRKNEPQFPHRIIIRREPNPDYINPYLG